MEEAIFIYQLIKLLLEIAEIERLGKRYNGVNLSLLAAEYGMSVNNLRNIIKEN